MRVHAEPSGAGFSLLPAPSPANHARLILWTAELFDRLAASDFDLARTAALCGASVSQLERAMRKYPQVWRSWSESRRKNGGGARD